MSHDPDGMLAAALDYAEHGVPVFPLYGVGDGRCACGNASCENAGKHPLGRLVSRGFKDATTTARTVIRDWWTAEPTANIAEAQRELWP